MPKSPTVDYQHKYEKYKAYLSKEKHEHAQTKSDLQDALKQIAKLTAQLSHSPERVFSDLSEDEDSDVHRHRAPKPNRKTWGQNKPNSPPGKTRSRSPPKRRDDREFSAPQRSRNQGHYNRERRQRDDREDKFQNKGKPRSQPRNRSRAESDEYRPSNGKGRYHRRRRSQSN